MWHRASLRPTGISKPTKLTNLPQLGLWGDVSQKNHALAVIGQVVAGSGQQADTLGFVRRSLHCRGALILRDWIIVSQLFILFWSRHFKRRDNVINRTVCKKSLSKPRQVAYEQCYRVPPVQCWLKVGRIGLASCSCCLYMAWRQRTSSHFDTEWCGNSYVLPAFYR